MSKLLLYFCRHPWLVLLSLMAISLFAAMQLPKVHVQISAEDLLVQNDPQRAYYDEMAALFGDEKVILIYLSDQQLLEKSKLTVLKQALDELEALSFVKTTQSLFTVPYIKTVDGYLNKDPYLQDNAFPEDAASEKQLLDSALLNPFVNRVLLSEDARVMAVAVILEQDLSGFSDVQITDSIAVITSALEEQYQQVFSIGFQHVRNDVARQIKLEQTKLFPLAVAALLIALFLLLRQMLDILIPVMTAGLSILWILGLMGLLGIPLNVVTSIIPVLLIIVGSTEDIHLLSEFRRGQKNGMDKISAIQQMSKKMGTIVALTFVTTFIGFFSVSFSRIDVLWQFGILSSTALLLNFVITITLIPVLLRLFGDLRLDGKSGLFGTPDVGASRSRDYFLFLRKHRWLIGVVIVTVSVVMVGGILSIKVNHNPLDSLSDDSAVKKHFTKVNENLSGLESLSIIIDSGIQDTFLKARYLVQLKLLQDYIKTLPGVRSSTSFADYLALLNGAFEDQVEPSMPDADEIISELMIFLKHEHVQAYVTSDYSRARIFIRHNLSSTNDLKLMVNQLQQFIDANLDPGLQAKLTGDSILTLSATDAMIEGQLKSILLLLIIIIFIISMLFLDWKVGLFAAIPNVFPVIILFGVMGYYDIPLNIGTTMAAAIAIGIAVDDTMHFMLRYNKELKIKKSQSAAMYETIHSEALPVLATSLALIAGFLVFSLSAFEPVAQFGFLSALVMFAAMIADFVITPLAISTLRLVSLWDMLSLTLKKEVIEKSQLFRGMRPWQIRHFILASTVEHYKPGESVFLRDDKGDAMYLVMRGEIAVTHFGQIDTDRVEHFTAGDLFGDISMFARADRASDAIAMKHSSLLVLSREAMESTTSYHPLTSARFFYNIATHVSLRFIGILKGSDKTETPTHDKPREET